MSSTHSSQVHRSGLAGNWRDISSMTSRSASFTRPSKSYNSRRDIHSPPSGHLARPGLVLEPGVLGDEDDLPRADRAVALLGHDEIRVDAPAFRLGTAWP